jgi:preprotein translocase subunit SecF
MMTLIFLSLAVIIAIVVILVSAKFIKAGFDARGEVKEQLRNENVSQEDEEILDKLKDKNLSPEDLKKIYEDLQKKK